MNNKTNCRAIAGLLVAALVAFYFLLDGPTAHWVFWPTLALLVVHCIRCVFLNDDKKMQDWLTVGSYVVDRLEKPDGHKNSQFYTHRVELLGARDWLLARPRNIVLFRKSHTHELSGGSWYTRDGRQVVETVRAGFGGNVNTPMVQAGVDAINDWNSNAAARERAREFEAIELAAVPEVRRLPQPKRETA